MASSDKKNRFAGLRRTSERVQAGIITPHPEEPTPTPAPSSSRKTTAKGGSLKDRLGAKDAPSPTVRMSVEMPTEMHAQVTAIATRAGLPKAEVVRQILEETLPELI